MARSFEEQAALRRRSAFVTPHAFVTDPTESQADPEAFSWGARAASMSADNFSAGIDAAQGVV